MSICCTLVNRMGRKYKRTSTRVAYGQDALRDALESLKDGIPLKTAAKQHGIPPRTLKRHRDGKVLNPGIVSLGRFRPQFIPEYEAELVDLIQSMEKAMFGLSCLDVRRLAFDFAVKMDLQHRFSVQNKLAGVDWLKGFMARNPQLSIRLPEGTNMSRAVGFNREQVATFYRAYREVLIESGASALKVWNVDETGVSTVQKPTNRDAAKCALFQLVGPVKAVNARTRKRKSEKATVLTGSPYKNLLETKVVTEKKQNKDGSVPEKKKKCYKKSDNHREKTTKTTKKKTATKNKHKAVGGSNNDEPCSTCKELFSEDRSGRQWIQCQKCVKWFHNECQGIHENYKENNFTCIVCDDDGSD